MRMIKNIRHRGHFILIILLVIALQSDRDSCLCFSSCDGMCTRTFKSISVCGTSQKSNQITCCLDDKADIHPCCQFENNIPENSLFVLPATDRIKSADILKTGVTGPVNNPETINQTRFYETGKFIKNFSNPIPIYLKNLSILC